MTCLTPFGLEFLLSPIVCVVLSSICVQFHKMCLRHGSMRSPKQTKIAITRTVTTFDDFKVGDMVKHSIFGEGKIMVLSGTGENQRVGAVSYTHLRAHET